MKRFAVLSLALVVGLVTALGAAQFLRPRAKVVHARAQWANVYRTPAGLVAGADLIAVARHLSAQPGRVVGTGDAATPFTYNGFAIERVVKGVHHGAALVVEQTGGPLAGDGMLDIDDGGPFTPGQSYLLFLKNQGNGVFYQINHQARYEVRNGSLVGVDPTDRVVAALHGQSLDGARAMIERRVKMMQ